MKNTANTQHLIDGAPWWQCITREYAPTLLKFLSMRISHTDDARDLSQEAFLRLTRALDKNNIENPHGYLFRIAANLANEYLLKKQTQGINVTSFGEGELDALEDGKGMTPLEDNVEVQETLAELDRILGDLPVLYKSVLMMRKRDGYSHQEIAEKLNISKHTVHIYLTKALAACRQNLREKQ